MSKKDVIVVSLGKDKKGNKVYWIFFGIVAFIAVYFPFFGGSLKYQTGSMVEAPMNLFGTAALRIGALMFVWGLLSLFCSGGRSGMKLMLLGVVVILIGSYFVNPATIGGLSGEGSPTGYH